LAAGFRPFRVVVGCTDITDGDTERDAARRVLYRTCVGGEVERDSACSGDCERDSSGSGDGEADVEMSSADEDGCIVEEAGATGAAVAGALAFPRFDLGLLDNGSSFKGLSI